ncbi:MAG: cupin domain-containing protein [Bacteroidota bacterium]
MTPIALADKFEALEGLWEPRVVAELNGQAVKVARVHGAFVWHKHDDIDELFWVVRGRLRIEFRDRVVELGPGEVCVVPRGVEHRPVADEPTEIVLFEPLGVVNTGDAAPSDLTAPVDARL